MLKTLYDLAEAENLVGDPAFEQKSVAWTLVVHPKGVIKESSFVSNAVLGEQEYDKKGKPKKRRETVPKMKIPRQFVIRTGSARTSGAYAYFLVDKAEYVFGFAPGSSIGEPQTNPKLKERHGLFLHRLQQCVTATNNIAVKQALLALQSIRDNGLPCRLPEKMKANDLIAIRLSTDNVHCLHNYPEVQEFWHQLIADEQQSEKEKAEEQTCLVTGKPFTRASLFPLIKRVPGGSTSGAGLVSFNSGVFESYGWKGSANAQISPEAAQHISTALNRLLDPSFQDSDGNGRPRASELIAKDTTIAFWFKDLELLAEPDPAMGGDFFGLLRSHWKGKPPYADDAEDFYAFTLSGAQGRVIIRDYYESKASTVYEHLNFHWESLQIIPLTPPKKGENHLPALYSTKQLLYSATVDSKQDSLIPSMVAHFYQSILQGPTHPLPVSLVHKIIARFTAEIHDDDWLHSLRRDRQTALLKAYLIRNENLNLSLYMNPTNKEPAYLYGRLFSCYAEMQRLANYPRKVNVGVTQKYFAKFLAQPYLTYSSLQELYQHHRTSALKNSANLGKSKATAEGMGVRLSREIERIHQGLDPDRFEDTLQFTTRDKALFTLGFQHQNHWHTIGKQDRIAALDAQGISISDPGLLTSLAQPSNDETKTTQS